MKKTFFIALLLFVIGRANAQIDNQTLEIMDQIETSWNSLWRASSPFAKLEATEFGELALPEEAPNTYMKTRKKLLKLFEKSKKRISKGDREQILARFKDKLYSTIESGAIDQMILRDAHLYLQLLPLEEIKQRTDIYTNILLPIYYDQGNLKEIHYIARLLLKESETTYDPENYLLKCAEEAMAQYNELKAGKTDLTGDLSGMWVSMSDKKYPKYMLTIHDADSALLAILHPFVKKNSVHPKRFIVPVRYDSLDHMKLFFTNTLFRQGMDASTVQHLGGMANNIGETMVRSVNQSATASLGAQLGVTAGASLLSGLMMWALSNASVNTNTNTYIDMDLTPGEDTNQLKAEVKSKIELYKSNNSVPKTTIDRSTVEFRRIFPDDELFFVKGRKCMVLGNPSRQAYLNREYYEPYAGYNSHRKSHQFIKNAPWYIFYNYAVIIPYLVSDHGNYNKKIYQQMKKRYE